MPNCLHGSVWMARSLGPSIWVGPLINDNFRRITLASNKRSTSRLLWLQVDLMRFYPPSQLARSLLRLGMFRSFLSFFCEPKLVGVYHYQDMWKVTILCQPRNLVNTQPVGGPTAQNSFGMMLPDTGFWDRIRYISCWLHSHEGNHA